MPTINQLVRNSPYEWVWSYRLHRRWRSQPSRALHRISTWWSCKGSSRSSLPHRSWCAWYTRRRRT